MRQGGLCGTAQGRHYPPGNRAEFPTGDSSRNVMRAVSLKTQGKQSLTEASATGAPRGLARQWESIDFKHALKQVRRLQRRIAKAVAEGRWNKVKVLQRLLTRSYWAKVLAVRKVTSNRGARTPGVDGKRWTTSAQKMKGALSLVKRGYRAFPLRRILIPKKPGFGQETSARNPDHEGPRDASLASNGPGTDRGNPRGP